MPAFLHNYQNFKMEDMTKKTKKANLSNKNRELPIAKSRDLVLN